MRLWITNIYAAATVPKIINYQARITDVNGVPVPDGALNVKIAIYDQSTSGTCMYEARGSCGTPLSKSVTVKNGVFSTLIGEAGDNAIPDALFDNQTLYLGITVGPDSEMTPRKRLGAVGYAFNADRLDDLDTSDAGGPNAYVPVTNASGNLIITSRIGIGTLTPAASLEIVNPGLTGGVPTLQATSHFNEAILQVFDRGRMIINGYSTGGAALTVNAKAGQEAFDVTGGGINLNAGTSTAAINSLNWSISSAGVATGLSFAGGPTFTKLTVSGSTPSGTLATAATDATGGLFWQRQIFSRGNIAYVVNGSSNSLQVFDVSDPASPALLSTTAIGAAPSSVAAAGKYAYVSTIGSGFFIYDVANPKAPVLVGNSGGFANLQSLAVQGRYLYAGDHGSDQFKVYDISNPARPALVGSTPSGVAPNGIALQGKYAYVINLTSGTLQIFDVANPAAPTLVSTLSGVTAPRSLAVQGRYAYVGAQGSFSLKIIDVSDPAAPAIVGSIVTGGLWSIALQDRYAYTADYSGNTLDIIDVSSSTAPTLVGSAPAPAGPFSVAVNGRFAYTLSSSTLGVFDVGGAYIQQLEAGGIDASTLSLRGPLQGADGSFTGGVHIGGSINGDGDATFGGAGVFLSTLGVGANSTTGIFTVSGSSTDSTLTLFQIQNANDALQYLAVSATSTLIDPSHIAGFGVGIGTNAPTAVLTVDDSDASPAGNIFQIANANDATRYLTVSSTSTVVTVNGGATDTTIGLCKSAADSAGVETGVELVDCASTPGDVAEWYPTDRPVSAGDILTVSDETVTYQSEDIDPAAGRNLGTKSSHAISVLRKAPSAYARGIIGIVSTSPFQSFGKGVMDASSNTAPVALVGRVPTKVSGENGPIKPGDPIATSSTPGVGMKATEAGMIVGYALDAWNDAGAGSIEVFVSPGWYNGPDAVSGSVLGSTMTVGDRSLLDFKASVLSNVSAIISTSGLWSVTDDGYLVAQHVEAKTMKTETLEIKRTDEAATIGEGTILAGHGAAVIANPAMKPMSEVFLTFRDDPVGGSWVAERGDGTFTVHLSQPAPVDLKFAYWIVGVEDQRTPPP